MVITIALIMLCALSFIVVLVIISPGRIEPVTDSSGQRIAGSISEKIFVDIGGVRQGMFIRSTDVNNPVLLFVHGGPAFPEYFLVEKYHVRLEDYFTVCYWEQRGGGLSFTKEVTRESMTLEQLRSDAVEVTNYLRERFDKEKIFILAHSGGTSFAIKCVAEFPQLYHAYVAMEQITKQEESERLAYKYMIDKYASQGNQKMVSKFKKYPVLDEGSSVVPFFNSLLREESMHELGIGTMRNMQSIYKGVFFPVWACRAYTLKEKINFWRSKFSFIKTTGLRGQVIAADFTKEVTKLDVPTYFISGKYDLTVNVDLSKAYLSQIEAPLKGFYTFYNSAHSPMFEEPERVREVLVKDVLNKTNTLADKE